MTTRIRVTFELAMDAQELFEALDEWLSKGGFLPTAWKTPGPDSPYR